MAAIDLNSDLGEGFGRWRLTDDRALLNIVTSANIACGFHAGDPAIMATVVSRAVANGVSIGAHIAYRDLVGFGRRPMVMTPDELTADVIYQIGALQAFARVAGTDLTHVKAHGALYNTTAHHAEQAQSLIEAVVSVDPELTVLGLAGSPFLNWAAAAGLKTCSEVFADRAYHSDGSLVPRSHPAAVIHATSEVVERAVAMATGEPITAIDGSKLRLRAESICVHGDSPDAVALATAVREGLTQAGVSLLGLARG